MSLTIDLTGRVALVTGGVRGVGLGITRALLEAGATVVTCARSEAEPVEGSTHLTCDVRDPDAVTDLVDRVVAQHGRLDVLVNNAGGAPYALAADASARFHEKVTALNLLAPLTLMQAANAVMQEQDSEGQSGAIVNVSSVSALRPSPGTASYGAAKAGLDSLTRTLAVEWAPKVRVNAIDVGLVLTEQTDLHYGGADGVTAIEKTIPLGRLARPEEVGAVAAFLASPLASYVSGATLECHGGGERPAFLTALTDSRLPVVEERAKRASRNHTLKPRSSSDHPRRTHRHRHRSRPRHRPRARPRAGPPGREGRGQRPRHLRLRRGRGLRGRPTRWWPRSRRSVARPWPTAPTSPTSSRRPRWCSRRSTPSAASTSWSTTRASCATGCW